MSFFDTPIAFRGKTVLLLGSGGLRIAQAGEFDYSGSQAIKAMKEEGIRVVLVNPNIASVQTDPELVDKLYLQPLNLETVTQIIEQENPQGVLLSFGGQTALNLGLALEDAGIFKKHKISILGSSLDVIRRTEDRDLFKKELFEIGVKSPKSMCVNTIEAAIDAAESIGYPIMMRSGFTLGGLGSGKVANRESLIFKAQEALNTAPHVLIEEYLLGWKEFEYEIVRDYYDNALTICNMENMDPMGIHTGESIVVAPSQTLSNQEYHYLRTLALKIVRHFKVLGECNIQFAINPKNGDYRVIEMNARLSRSSALASKATGYPLAFVAAKLALRYPLHAIQNSVTKKTCAFFEPALDYIIVKIPRWDLTKLRHSDRMIGTEMKSVGEVMAIGRSFPEALQKAIGSLNIGASCIADYPYAIEDPEDEIIHPTDRRIFALYKFFEQGNSVAEAHALSHIDIWFLQHIYAINQLDKTLKKSLFSEDLLRQAKLFGFSDKYLATLYATTEQKFRATRLALKITPVVKQIDTLAGEFNAETNYLYLTYYGRAHDIKPSTQAPVIVLGSGPYSIGSSVEFDWCAVNTIRALRELKTTAIMINANPETVSTDYDESDRLYFEQLSVERVQDIADFEKPQSIVVSVGGQAANNLALILHQAGYKILGTAPQNIDIAENRKLFSTLLNQLDISQPMWSEITSLHKAKIFADAVQYPVLIRPSYVLSGSAMNVVYNDKQLEFFLREAVVISRDYPVVITKFITDAKELEIDGVAKNGTIIVDAVLEHIENAGVHSGDATIIFPPQQLHSETIHRAKQIAKQVVKALDITGPFNIQFLEQDNDLLVIECNVRASRSFPFVSKVTNHNFIKTAIKAMAGISEPIMLEALEPNCVAVKFPQFSYHRLKGIDSIAHVEMASTGEVAVISDCLTDAFYRAWQSTEQKLMGKCILVDVHNMQNKVKLIEIIKILNALKFEFYTTDSTHDILKFHDVSFVCLKNGNQKDESNIMTFLARKKIDLMISIPSNKKGDHTHYDGFEARRCAIDYHIPLVTNLKVAELLLQSIAEWHNKLHKTQAWDAFMKT